MEKNIIVLGSTGSIGTQTLDVVRKQDDLHVIGLSCGKNVQLFEQQIREFHPKYAVVDQKKDADDLRVRLKDLPTMISYGMEGLIDLCVCQEADTVVTAIVGMIGIQPTIAAIESGKTICLANKETLVTAGHIIMPLAKEKGVPILPVDSEHSAIFQCLQGNRNNPIERILLTASGGPFRGLSTMKLQQVKLEDALKHPNWSMGRKITIDSATMVNKGLEVMEAMWLFGVTKEQIQVVVHPQSIIHSMVEYTDGAVMAQLGTPDMKLPIQYALNYPERKHHLGDPLDLFKIGHLDFEKPDTKVFKGLQLAYDAIEMSGNAATIYNAANEIAVEAFLNRKISFLGIADWIEEALNRCTKIEHPTVSQILETQQEVNDYFRKQR